MNKAVLEDMACFDFALPAALQPAPWQGRMFKREQDQGGSPLVYANVLRVKAEASDADDKSPLHSTGHAWKERSPPSKRCKREVKSECDSPKEPGLDTENNNPRYSAA